MNRILLGILRWAPRVLTILFALFTALFALDVFEGHYGFWGTVLALAIHLIPTGLIVLALVLAWRREIIGGVVFAALAVVYIVTSWGRFPFVTYLTISGPMFLISILFFINAALKLKSREPQ